MPSKALLKDKLSRALLPGRCSTHMLARTWSCCCCCCCTSSPSQHACKHADKDAPLQQQHPCGSMLPAPLAAWQTAIARTDPHAACDPRPGPLAAWVLQSSTLLRLLQDFGEHGREFITCEVGMELVKLLAEPARLAQALSGVSNSSAPRTIDSLINHVVFKVGACQGWL